MNEHSDIRPEENSSGDKPVHPNLQEIDPQLLLTLGEKISSLPTKPGVYLHKNSDGKIIYVGKAKNLRNRVRSYFQQGRPVDAKTKALVRKIADFDVIITTTEAEALMLENNLIKEHKPRYNVMLRDDKSYPYIRITNEPYPRVFPTRKVIRDGSKYFGPYAEAKTMRYLLKTIRTIFPIRSCDYDITQQNIDKKKFRVCLDFHIGKCEGPCEGLVSREHYGEYIRQTVNILNGRTKEAQRALEAMMERFAESLEFEKAALTRNRLHLLREFESKQKVITTELIDRDVIAFCRRGNDACSVIFTIREGKLIGKRHYFITNAGDKSDAEIISSTVEKWFIENDFIPPEVLLNSAPMDMDFLEKWLREKRGSALEISVPKIGDKRKIVEMAETNADFLLQEFQLQHAQREATIPRPVIALQRDLRMSKPPRRIECFDNSHLQGSEYVSSMVVFADGKPKKSEYRKFRLRTVEGNDDYAAMQEVVHRRYSRMLEENSERPDLIIIDGGKGQLSAASAILEELGLLGKIPVIGLAKRLEEIFFPGQSESLLLPKTSSSLNLIQRVRDEAHRFAITYHRQLRSKRTITSELLEIPGVGEKTAQRLLIEFGSVEGVKNAGDEQIIKVSSKRTLAALKRYFAGEMEYFDQTVEQEDAEAKASIEEEIASPGDYEFDQDYNEDEEEFDEDGNEDFPDEK